MAVGWVFYWFQLHHVSSSDGQSQGTRGNHRSEIKPRRDRQPLTRSIPAFCKATSRLVCTDGPSYSLCFIMLVASCYLAYISSPSRERVKHIMMKQLRVCFTKLGESWDVEAKLVGDLDEFVRFIDGIPKVKEVYIVKGSPTLCWVYQLSLHNLQWKHILKGCALYWIAHITKYIRFLYFSILWADWEHQGNSAACPKHDLHLFCLIYSKDIIWKIFAVCDRKLCEMRRTVTVFVGCFKQVIVNLSRLAGANALSSYVRAVTKKVHVPSVNKNSYPRVNGIYDIHCLNMGCNNQCRV